MKKIDGLILQCLDIIGENITRIQANPENFGIREGKMVSEYVKTLIIAKKIEEGKSSDFKDLESIPTDELAARAREILKNKTAKNED